jgi:hypothetical protein
VVAGLRGGREIRIDKEDPWRVRLALLIFDQQGQDLTQVARI